MLNERFAQQVAYARTGLVIEGGQGAPLRVVHVAEGSPAEAVGIRPGDVVSTATGLPNYLGSTVHQVATQLSAEGPITMTIIRDNERLDLSIDRSPGGVVFKDNIATVDAFFVPAAAPNPFAAREAAERERMQEARAARPFGDFHPDLAAVLQLIYDGQHSEARRYRRQAAARTDNPLTLFNDLFLTPAAAAYEMQAWRPLARDYGLARSAFLGACGDVIARDITLDWVRDGVRTGRTEARTLYLLRGLETDITQHIEQTGSIDIVLGQDATLRGWFTFFAAHGCGSPVIERLDREMVAFAGRG